MLYLVKAGTLLGGLLSFFGWKSGLLRHRAARDHDDSTAGYATAAVIAALDYTLCRWVPLD